jgi:hypothetical protein
MTDKDWETELKGTGSIITKNTSTDPVTTRPALNRKTRRKLA